MNIAEMTKRLLRYARCALRAYMEHIFISRGGPSLRATKVIVLPVPVSAVYDINDLQAADVVIDWMYRNVNGGHDHNHDGCHDHGWGR